MKSQEETFLSYFGISKTNEIKHIEFLSYDISINDQVITDNNIKVCIYDIATDEDSFYKKPLQICSLDEETMYTKYKENEYFSIGYNDGPTMLCLNLFELSICIRHEINFIYFLNSKYKAREFILKSFYSKLSIEEKKFYFMFNDLRIGVKSFLSTNPPIKHYFDTNYEKFVKIIEYVKSGGVSEVHLPFRVVGQRMKSNYFSNN